MIRDNYRLEQENERLRQRLKRAPEPGWGLRREFVEGLQERQELLHKEPDKDCSGWWLLLPFWLLGSSIYTAYVIFNSVISLL
jgi:hypothetical protein